MKFKHSFLKKAGIAVAFAMTACFSSTMLTSCMFGNTGETQGAISLSETSHSMYVSDSFKLTATTADSNAEITWTSSNEKVATVKRGLVTAVGVGKTVITAALADGTTATCEVTVSDRTVTISESAIEINIDNNDTYTLTATASDNGQITWTSSDTSVATVSGGVVTATNPGTVTITAQRGSAKATCEVTVIMPSRPADYRVLTQMNNAGCVNDPGTWYYWADGSSGDCNFATKPNYGGNALNVSISSITEGKYFMFRYQPNVDKDGTALNVGDKYKVTFKATMSLNGTLRYGGLDHFTQTEVTAGEEQTFTCEAIIKSSEPFSIRPQDFDAPSESNPLKLTITDIEFELVEAGVEEDNSQSSRVVVDIEPNILGTYNLEAHTNPECVSDPGKVHYFADGGEGTDYAFAETPSMTDGVVTFSFSKMTSGKNCRLRVQPDLPVGTQYAITFTVNLNRKSTLTIGTKGKYENVSVAANTDTKITYIGTVNTEEPFSITLNSYDATEENPVTLKVFDIGAEEYTAPAAPIVDIGEIPTEGTALETKRNADVVASPGSWYYFADGEYTFKQDPIITADGEVVFAFNSVTNNSTYQLRYQPNYETGTKYTISFDVTYNRNGSSSYILYGQGSTPQLYFTEETTATQHVTYNGEVNSTPFFIQFKDYDASADAPIVLIISNIVVSEYVEPEVPETPTTPDTPSENQNAIAEGSKDVTIANAGTWYYNSDNGKDAANWAFVNGAPTYEDGTLTLSYQGGASDDKIYLRYQPAGLAEGTEYTVTFTATLNRTGEKTITVFNDNINKFYHFDTTADEEQTITATFTVSSAGPLQIRVNCFDGTESNPVVLTIKDFTVTPKTTETAPDENEKDKNETDNNDGETSTPDVPQTVTAIEYGNNPTVKANQGTWYYFADGTQDTDYTLYQKPGYTEDGSLVYALSAMTDGKVYQLRYQPDGEIGTEYTISFDVTYNRAGYILYSGEYKKAEFAEAGTQTITYTGTISNDTPFFIQIKNFDASADDPVVLIISNIVVSEYVEPEVPETPTTPDTPSENQYTLTKGSKDVTIANAGTWYYNADKGSDTASWTFVNGDPTYKDGTITLSYKGGADNDKIYLRYQPTDIAVGGKYTITFKATVNRTSEKAITVTDGTTYMHYAATAGEEQTITVTLTVSSSEPLQIRANCFDGTEDDPVVLTISDVVITPVSE